MELRLGTQHTERWTLHSGEKSSDIRFGAEMDSLALSTAGQRIQSSVQWGAGKGECLCYVDKNVQQSVFTLGLP